MSSIQGLEESLICSGYGQPVCELQDARLVRGRAAQVQSSLKSLLAKHEQVRAT